MDHHVLSQADLYPLLPVNRESAAWNVAILEGNIDRHAFVVRFERTVYIHGMSPLWTWSQ